MVKCGDEPVVAPPLSPKAAAMAPASKASSGVGLGEEPTYCFRLQEAPDRDSGRDRDSAASTSVYSIYKQRIDQMFDETRSQMSSSACRTTTSYSCCQQEERRRQRREEGGSRRPRISNSVQARIEKMFADMAEAAGAAAAAAASASAAGPPPPAGPSSGRFPVEYLGAVPLRDKVTTLSGLQQPLADLYLGRHHHDGAGGSGWLEICPGGLQVEARGRRWLTAFPSIAVWAAVKFVRRRRGADAQFAFLPLIADPDAVDKDALFRPLPASAGSYAERLGHSPVLAVVMRGGGGASGGRRQLDCHGFVCERAEDAVVVAAALYQALVAHLDREGGGRDRRPTSRHDGVSYAPAASSVAGSSEAAPSALSEPASSARRQPSPAQQLATPSQDHAPPLPAPVRPPRKKRSSVSSASEDGEDAIKVLSSEEIPPPQRSGKNPQSQSKSQQEQSHKLPPPTPPHQQQHQQQHQQKPQLPQSHEQSQRHQLPQHQHQRQQLPQQQQHDQQPAASGDPRRNAGPGPDYHDVRRQHRHAPGGDILTKVAIPRSSSFLNAGGPLSRYSGRSVAGSVGVGDCSARGIGGGVGGGVGGGTLYSSDGGGSSPLGFNELFTEFRVHEGLHSTDDILDAIIDAEGMSFNDLKPIYKEFLLKLAFTLTRDELYQRSKSIMRRQRKKQKHRAGLYASGGGLKRAFRRSVSKLKPRPGSFEFTSVLFQPRPARASKKCKKPTLVTGKCSSSTSSTFSSRGHKLRTGTNRLPRRLSSRRRAGAAPPKRRSTVSTSEDSDFVCGADVRLAARGARSAAPAPGGGIANNNRSSSGYFSCSECSYDSESCTCTSADKCYCSLGGGGGGRDGGNASSARGRKRAPATPGTTSCDSESCGAGRCCTCGVPRPSVPYRQVSKQMESPDTAWKRNERRTRAALQQQTTARKRMDVYSDVAVRPQYHLPSEFRDFSSTSDLALDYELFTVAKSDRNSVCEDRKVLVVSARDPRGRLLYVGPASCRASSSSDSQRRSHKARAPPRPGNSAASEALSVKKSAEIAALFSKPTLSGPSDEVFYNTLEPPDYYLTTRGPKTASNYMASNLENSLGYLP